MEHLQLTETPVAKTGMLIRKPIAEVFEAFANPGVTSQFWFTHGSGRLTPGQRVEWTWEMYDFTVPVEVIVVEPNRRIVVKWPTIVEWTFEPLADGNTFVQIVNSGFTGDTGDELVRQATDSTEGFTIVLAGLKAYLEFGIRLNLVGDRFPRGLGES